MDKEKQKMFESYEIMFSFHDRVSITTLNVSFAINILVLLFFTSPLVQGATTKLANNYWLTNKDAKSFSTTGSLFHLVLGYDLIGNFVTFINEAWVKD